MGLVSLRSTTAAFTTGEWNDGQPTSVPELKFEDEKSGALHRAHMKSPRRFRHSEVASVDVLEHRDEWPAYQRCLV